MSHQRPLQEEEQLELIPSEEADADSAPAAYEINTYPADFTLEVLFGKYRRNQIKVPGFQRKYVWRLEQGSRLIESFLLGLPVPPVFLYTDSDNSLLAIDGQQRLKTVFYFFEGFFGEENRGKRPVFRLSGLNVKSPFANKTYSDLEKTDPTNFNKLNDAVLRALIIKQLDPNDNTSVHHIFERLNTGGTLLRGQEIRNCIYHGPFNDLLYKLNKVKEWRLIFGTEAEDKRQRDVELILRFLALFKNKATYVAPMKDFLSSFMWKNRLADEKMITEFSEVFSSTCTNVIRQLGERPFHIRRGLNAAVFDSVFIAFATNRNATIHDIKTRYETLIKDPKYLSAVGSATTGTEVVKERIDLATSTLFH